VPNVKAVIELSKLSICKLSSVVGDNSVSDAESTYYIFPNTVLNLSSGDFCERFRLNHMSEIIHRYQQEFYFSICWRKRVDYICPP